mmetsp:Transcript_21797/g.53890  ORF Transcript_21797/g.53890 Transcript_21797/m.53890 type:complete len:84 (-) Transcript_21797:910-1161(-)
MVSIESDPCTYRCIRCGYFLLHVLSIKKSIAAILLAAAPCDGLTSRQTPWRPPRTVPLVCKVIWTATDHMLEMDARFLVAPPH